MPTSEATNTNGMTFIFRSKYPDRWQRPLLSASAPAASWQSKLMGLCLCLHPLDRNPNNGFIISFWELVATELLRNHVQNNHRFILTSCCLVITACFTSPINCNPHGYSQHQPVNTSQSTPASHSLPMHRLRVQ